ncbi:transcriptional regulator [Thermocladium modestius]|uniref:Transcriptional regulator n=1 Tax=Thermocladium modestius TaxID=62609 RepID=A0A830GX86_9CREN|nr:winged helix-turn-helix domain-containing protein [Thermocladium modestius]GGP22306.1 transcriptional regulator [Thermocladium modestius]
MRDKKKRSRIEIIADILAYLDKNGCSRPTRMATALNLSYDKLMDYVKELDQRGMIMTNMEGICITSRGLQFLREYTRWSNFAKSFGIDV